MDVVALAQHGVEYAVATLGTATTPVHAQKLFRLTDTVVFCFDGDNAGRKAAWRALENTLPVLADGKNAVFLFLPDGEDPDDFVRQRGKAAFERAIANAVPLSEFLLAELVARHPPTSSEGRAALVAAARPMLGEIAAPVLAAILRRRLGELSGLPESELRDLLQIPGEIGAGTPVSRDRPNNDGRAPRMGYRAQVRRPPSLARQLIRGLLLQPALAKSLPFPRPDERTPEAATLTALVVFCAEAERALTTAGVLQAFADTPHAAVLGSVLATAEDQHLDDVAIAAEVRDGLDRWWQQARRDGAPAPMSADTVPAEETNRVQQLDYVRRREAERNTLPPADLPDGRPAEGAQS